MRDYLKKYSRYYLATLFVVVLVLLPTHPAKANLFTEWSFELVFGKILFLVFSIAGKMIAALAILLNWAIHIPVYPDKGIAVIDKSWEIMRNFANMFFIVALILMAFATIFDVLPGAAKYNARALFGRFLFTALLINFSLVLGVMVINGTQVLSNTFLVSIGDMANRLGQDLNPSQLLPSKANVTGALAMDSVVFGTISTLIFSIVLIFTFLFSILTAFIFVFIRIPILWALLIVSPIAWILNIFPSGEGTFKKWWHIFIGWNMFLPIYLFFLYFGLYFLSNQQNIIQSIAAEVSNTKITESLPFSLQLVFFYMMTAIFMIGGTIVAMKASMFSGTGVVGIAQWSRGVAARRLGLTQAGKAAQERWKQVQEEGLPGRLGALYGGQYGTDQETGVWARRFGVRGAEIKNQKAFVDRASKDYTDFERQYQNGQITETEVANRAKQFKATDSRGFAYRKLAAKIGQLDPQGEILTTTLQQLSTNPLAAEDFTKSASEGKFSKMKGKDLARMAGAESGPGYDYSSLKSSIAARREMFRYVMTDTKAMSGLEDGQIEAGISVFGGHTTAEGKNFLKEVGKINPAFAVGYNTDAARNPDLVDDAKDGFNKAHGRMPSPGPAGDFELKTQIFGGFLRSGEIKDVAGIKISTLENHPQFLESLKIYISQFSTERARKSYVQRLEKALLDTPGGDRKWDLLKNGRGIIGDPDYVPVTIGPNYATAPRRLLVPPAGTTPPLG